MSFSTWLCFVCALIFPVLPPALEASPLRDDYGKAIKALRTYHPSAIAKSRVLDYAGSATSGSVRRGLEFLLEDETQNARTLKSKRRLMRRIKINGRENDWGRLNVIERDELNDTKKVDQDKQSGTPDAADDLAAHAFIMDSRYIYVMVKPQQVPGRGAEYHYRINFSNDNWNMIYAVVWTSAGNVVQEWDPVTGDFIRLLKIPGAKFRQGRVFEARIPVRALRKLPYQFHVQSVVWHAFKNLYDVNYNSILGISEAEKYKATALELLLRYAEEVKIPADDPFFVVQALSDAYIFKAAESSLKNQVMQDGLSMIAFAHSLGAGPFQEQAPLSEMSFEALLSWANRSVIYGDYYAIDYYVAKLHRINREAYEFMILQPDTLNKCSALLQSEGLINPESLVSTADKLNEWIWARNKYRRTNFSDIEEMYLANPDDPWIKTVYEESLYEKNHGLTNVARINGVDINKGAVFSPSFQIDYVQSHGLFYGNCVDVVAIESACLKALGIPGIHVHYGLVSPEQNRYTGYHSVLMYYSSSRDRWVNFEMTEDQLDGNLEPSDSGRTVAWQISRPPAGSFWESRTTSLLGLPFYPTTRTVYGTMEEPPWWKIYYKGFSNEEMAERLQLR